MKKILFIILMALLFLIPFVSADTPYLSDYSASNKLLLHMNGTQGGTTFIDSSTGKTVTAAGSAHTDASVKKFGSASLYTDTSSDYLSIPYSTDLNLSTNNVTIMAWVNFTTIPAQGEYQPFISQYNSTESKNWYWGVYGDLNNVKRMYIQGSSVNLNNVVTVNANTWYQFVLIHNGTHWSMYQDGVLIGNAQAGSNLPSVTSPTLIGHYDPVAASLLTARSDELCVWADGVTPSISALYPQPYEIGYTAPIQEIVANFTATPLTSSIYSLRTQFTNTSLGSPTTWNWTFGDGYTSTLQNPNHTYMVAGYYDIGLNVTNSTGGYNLLTKTQYISLLSDSDTYLRSWNDFNSTISGDHQGVAWSTFGTPSINTNVKKFGAGSLYIPNSNSYVYSPSSSIWDRSSIAGEVEYWINITTLGDAGKPLVKRSTGADGISDGWGMLNINGTQNGYAFWYGNGATNYTKPFTLTSNVWHHVILTRNTTGYWNVYVDGNFWSATYLDSLQVDTTNQFQIGASGPGNEFVFYLDEFRYSQGVDRVDAPYSLPLTAYVGSLQASIDTSPNSTFRYKTDPSNEAIIYNQTNSGTRNQTLQIQNVTEANYIIGAIAFDPTTERVKNIFVNSTNYPDITIVSSSVDYTHGEIAFNVSRGGTNKFVSLFDNRTNLLDIQFLYYNYTTQHSGTQFFDYGYLINGTSSCPIHNFIATNITYGDWVIMNNFSANRTLGSSGTPIKFTDLSTGEPYGYTTWLWGFGDGSTSAQQNPVYSYSSLGLYTVSLTTSLVANSSVTNTTVKTGYINITSTISDPPVAAFSGTPTMIAMGSLVAFTDASTNNPTSWLWNFGDSISSTLKNPTHTYSTIGNYTVSLSATNAYGTGTTTKTNYIWVKSPGYGYTQQDIQMEKQYILTIYVKDATTGLAIPGATVNDGIGNNQTTNSIGSVAFNEPYSIVVGSIYADGYYARSYSVVVDNDTTVSYSMTQKTTSDQNTWYSPKQVGISVVRYNPAGKKVVNATVRLAAIGSTLQADSQLQTIYGINAEAANEMVNGTLIMTGITGGDGATAFTVLSSIMYNVIVTDPIDGKNYTTRINPIEDPYTIWIGTKATDIQNTSFNTINNTALYVTQPNSSYVTLNLRYQDLSGSTSNVKFYVVAAINRTIIFTEDLGNPGTSIIYANYTHKNIRGDGYYWYYNATRSE